MKTVKKITSVFIIAFVAAALAIVLNNKFFNSYDNHFSFQESTPVHLTKNVSGASSSVVLPDLTVAAEKTVPAVVHIEVKMKEQTDNIEDNPFFNFFFGPNGPQGGGRHFKQMPQYAMASGSGVIISPDGYIVTNNHVVDDAVNVQVILNDNRKFTAKVIGKDPNTDIALVKIDATDLPYLTWGNSDALKLGQWVLAVGNPFNLNSTVTAGIVSAKSRSIGIVGGQMPLESFIQTDAAVNPGNSGGALVDADGQLVGINTAIASQTGNYAGYAFAVPATIARKVVIDLQKYGEVQRAVLGVTMQSVNDSIAKAKDLKQVEGAFVRSTTEDGAARQAGIKKGDIIVSINGNSVKTGSQLQEQIGEYSPGDEVTVGYIRDGKLNETKVKLRNMKGDTSIIKEPISVLGAQFTPITDKLKAKLQLDNGVQVSKITDGKLKDAGVKDGFIISDINKQPVNSKDDVENIMMQTNSREPVLLEGVYPDGKYAYYILKPVG